MPLPSKDVLEHIRGLEALRYELAEVTSTVLQELYEKRAQSLVPKDAQWTDLDRKTMLDGFVAEKERDYQFLTRLEVIVSDRIDLAKLQIQVLG